MKRINIWLIVVSIIGIAIVLLLALNLFTPERIKQRNYLYYLQMKPQIVPEIAPTPTYCPNTIYYIKNYTKPTGCIPDYTKYWFQIFGKELFVTKTEFKKVDSPTPTPIPTEDLNKVNILSDDAKIIEAVSKLIVLPVGEVPSVATVTDPTKLQDQSFFQNAQNGDKVLIYTTAKKAILYRPSTNKVIDVAPINVSN